MNWIQILSGPAIGAVIGYCTNYIAVKMLFRPLKPIKIGNYTLPFTPGIIPKGKDRLARALGKAVGEELLTKKDMEDALLADEMKQMVRDSVAVGIEEDQKTIGQHIEGWMTPEKAKEWNVRMVDLVSEKIVNGLQKMGIGELIAREGGRIIKEKTEGTFLSMMINDNLIQSIVTPVGEEAEKYLEVHGTEKIKPIVEKEICHLEENRIEAVLEGVGTDAKQIGSLAENVYEEIVRKKGQDIIGKIHVAEIVEQKVQQMDVLDLEKLLLSIMKKELNAIVNLGAVIGFVIGCVNLLF
ncbi:MAG: DUF445 family protein [Lachnospiraceae bacterium]|nr:DUF445 family protein [Robinsoniella sp.]MDY3766921.1 DUF445 family protein [Lachnospiraceae bacterium]